MDYKISKSYSKWTLQEAVLVVQTRRPYLDREMIDAMWLVDRKSNGNILIGIRYLALCIAHLKQWSSLVDLAMLS